MTNPIEQPKAETPARWHDLWSHHASQCSCMDGKHDEADHASAAMLNADALHRNALEAALTAAREDAANAWEAMAVEVDSVVNLNTQLAAAQKRIEELETVAVKLGTAHVGEYARAQAAEAERDRYRAALEEIRAGAPEESSWSSELDVLKDIAADALHNAFA